MTDDLTPSGDGTLPSGDGIQTRTAEQVETEWRERVSGKDRAHNAELATLRETHAAELAAAKTAALEAAKGSQMTEAETWAAEKQRLEDELKAEREGRLIDTRKVKYAAAAETLGDDVIATLDEAKLEALEARLAAPPAPGGRPAPMMNPNAAPKPSAGAPVSEDKTSAELKADLERMGPEFAAQIGS